MVRASTDIAIAGWRTIAMDVVALHKGITFNSFAFGPGSLRSGRPSGSRSGTSSSGCTRTRKAAGHVNVLDFSRWLFFLIGFLFFYVSREGTAPQVIMIKSTEFNSSVPIAHESRAI
jgi:hypothetical protein